MIWGSSMKRNSILGQKSGSQFLICFILLLTSSVGFADELTIYIVEPPLALQWQSPSALVRSVYKARELDAPGVIGHVVVELKCEATSEGERIHFLDGMTMSDYTEADQAVERGRGLGVFIDNYSGELHGESYREQIKKMSCEKEALKSNGESRLSFLKLKINHGTCLRLAKYYEGFKERGLNKVYGGLNTHPLHGPQRGAGCSVFGVSFLEVAGFYDPKKTRLLADKWVRNFRIPMRFIGTADSTVSVLNIVLTGHWWANPAKPGVDVSVPDPALMAEWVAEKIKTHDQHYQVERLCNYSRGLTADLTALPTPTTPIFED